MLLELLFSVAFAKSEVLADSVAVRQKIVISQQGVVANSPSGTITLWFDGGDLKVKDSSGNTATIGSSQPVIPSGAVMAFAMSCPTGWLAADGSQVSRDTYASLFAAIGVTHGQGDGSTTFHIPDYRGRFLRGVDGGSGRDPDAAGRTAMNTGGNTGDNVGSVQTDTFGSHTHTQNAHSHYLFHEVNSAVSTTNDTVNTNDYVTSQNISASSSINYSLIGTTFAANEGLSSSTTATNQNSGGNETRPENANVNFCIKI